MLFFNRFGRRRDLFIKLGNCVSTAILSQKSGYTYEIIKRIEVENPFFKNGIIKRKDHFIEVMKQIMENFKEYSWSNVTVGLDSSQITYSSFEIQSGDPTELILLEYLNKFHPNHKLIHLDLHENRVACLSIPQGILDKIYSVMTQLNLKVNKFVSSNYLDSYSALEHSKEKLRMVFNLGYRSTTVSIFHADFLINYKTLTCGVEQIILALATKNSISIDDARSALKTVPLYGADERDWLSYSGKYFRMDKVSNMLNFYMTQMAHKILDRDCFYVNDLILTGWCKEIKGIEGIFKRFASNVTVVPTSIDEHYEKIFSLKNKYGQFAF